MNSRDQAMSLRCFLNTKTLHLLKYYPLAYSCLCTLNFTREKKNIHIKAELKKIVDKGFCVFLLHSCKPFAVFPIKSL